MNEIYIVYNRPEYGTDKALKAFKTLEQAQKYIKSFCGEYGSTQKFLGYGETKDIEYWNGYKIEKIELLEI